MAEPPRRARANRVRAARVRDPRLALAVGHELDPEAVRVGEIERCRRAAPSRPRPSSSAVLGLRRASSRGRARTRCGGGPARPRRARASTARPRRRGARRSSPPPRSISPNSFAQRTRASSTLSTRRQTWSIRARRITSGAAAISRRLVLGHRERDMDRVGRRRRAARRRSLRSTSHSTTVFESRPSPEISTSTRSPGLHRAASSPASRSAARRRARA